MKLLSILLLLYRSWKCDTLSLVASSPHSSGSVSRNNERKTSIHLVSLPKFSTPDPRASTIIDWKRKALGDGGVYWDQRPKSLATLNSALAEHVIYRLTSDSDKQRNMTTIECAVISTCARFEVLLCVQTQTEPLGCTHAMGDNLKEKIIDAVAECLTVQMINLNHLKWFRFRRNRDDIRPISTDTYFQWINNTQPEYNVRKLDIKVPRARPLRNLIAFVNRCKNGIKMRHQKRLLKNMGDLRRALIHTDDLQHISRYLSRIAAGMETSRGIFRPFSARDSHVMHQLKQSASGAIGVTYGNISSTQEITQKAVKYIKLIMDSALHAGKAARSPKKVPILDELRDALRKNDLYDHKKRIEISRVAELQALTMAVEPAIISCLSRFAAMENSKFLTEKYRMNGHKEACR